MKEKQEFNDFGECEKCKVERRINKQGICEACLEWLMKVRSDPNWRKERLGQLAKSENGIIQFTWRIMNAKLSQGRHFASSFERKSQHEIRQEYARYGRISEIDASALTKARAAAPYAKELYQVSDELFRKIKERPDDLDKMPSYKFEEFMADLLNRIGFHDVQLTPRTRDKGRDILAKWKIATGNLLTIVECKKYALARKVGVGIVERFLFTIRENDRASCGLIATTSFFSADAMARADQFHYQLHLADRRQIMNWVGQVGTWQKRKGSQLWIPSP
jgi:restriction endonuclease Mrr